MTPSTRNKENLFVVYDGECNLCLATTAKLRGLQSKANIHFISIQSIEQGKQSVKVPGIEQVSYTSLYEKIHVADEQGMLFAGADGIIRIMHTLKGFWPIAVIYHIPGMKLLGDRLYRFIAKRRYDWFGKTELSCTVDGCQLPPHKGEENE